jgi:hypothetical protein
MIYMGNESDQTAGTTEEVYLDSFDKMIAAVNGFSEGRQKTESLRGSSISSTAGKPHPKHQLSNHPCGEA